MKLVMLDRDGVINRFPGKGNYVVSPEQLVVLPRVLDAIRELTCAGCEVHIVSNQGCVSRGFLTRELLESMTESLLELIHEHGGVIRQIHYCLHQKSDNCECKKPKLKLFHEAIAGRALDMSEVYFVGDSVEDAEAARDLGCQMALVLSGRTTEEDLPHFPVKTQTVKKDLWDACQWILQKKS